VSRSSEIEKLLSLLQGLPVKEIKQLRETLAKRVRRINIPRSELEAFIKQNKSTQAIAQHYRVSPRTITRRIKEYELTGLRPKGRKIVPKAPKIPRIRSKWLSMRYYYNRLDKEYHFANIKAPPRKRINPQTLATTNTKTNPDGKYTTVGIYFIVQQSDVYLVYTLSIRYTTEPVPFKHIYDWVYPRVHDIVAEHAPHEAFVVDVIALTFENTLGKPERIEVGQ